MATGSDCFEHLAEMNEAIAAAWATMAKACQTVVSRNRGLPSKEKPSKKEGRGTPIADKLANYHKEYDAARQLYEAAYFQYLDGDCEEITGKPPPEFPDPIFPSL